jgi:hypothetical protein
MNKSFLSQSFLLILCFTLLACKQGATDSDKILDAQSCLDKASADEAEDCVAKVDGINSQAADLIRCSGKFVGEGFSDPSKLSTAMANLTNSGNGTNGSTAMIAALAFTAESTETDNSNSAQDAFNFCTSAKAKGLILLAGLSQTATVLASLSASIDLSNPSSITGTNLQTAMSALIGNPTASAAVGNAVVSMYSSNCTSGNSTTGNFCSQFQSVIDSTSGGTSNPSAVGDKLMTCYTTPATPGCSGF